MSTLRKISGQKDPVIKLLRDLRTEAGRRKHDRFIVESEGMVRRVFDFSAPAESIILSNRVVDTAEGNHLLDIAANLGVDAYAASWGLLGKAVASKPIPDVLAIVRTRLLPSDQLMEAPCPLVMMVDRGENADNLGMLLRSCDAAGVDGVVLTNGTTDPFSRRAVRGSRGAVLTLRLSIQDTPPARTLEHAKSCGLQIIASSANAEHDYLDADYTRPTLLVVGNEHTGISPAMQDLADQIVRIPMRGQINSLNIAVAASVLLYETVRQRSKSE